MFKQKTGGISEFFLKSVFKFQNFKAKRNEDS